MKTCRNCGTQMPDTARWCSQCGTPLDQPQQYNNSPYSQYPPQPNDRKNSNKSVLVAIYIVIALLIVAITLWFFVGRSGNDKGISLVDSIIDTSELRSENPWEEIDKQRAEAQNRRETIRIVEEPSHEPDQPAVQWTPRTINAKYYDTNGDYPVKITFEENQEGQLRNCTFNNVNYGSKIPLRGRSTGSGYMFSGNAGGSTVIVTLDDVGGGQLQGRASIAGKELTITASLY